jgi:hypothetical protein
MSQRYVKLLVATHKPYDFPESDIYYPIEVGAALRESSLGYLRDDFNKNISNKNGSFCELTALYWAWQNSFAKEVEYIGLVHYRRYFSGDSEFGDISILGEEKIKKLLSSYDIILPKKRNYYIETVYSHYKHAHYIEDIELLKETIEQISPEYSSSFDKVMGSRSLYLYNMFIMSDYHFASYCKWLFQILSILEDKIDISHREKYQQRVFGFLGERLLNVWLYHNRLRSVEVSVVNIEGENLSKKGIEMISRMITKKRRDS